jgi:hypothetical protein
LLGLVAAVDDAPLSERMDGLRQGMALLAFVEAGVASAARVEFQTLFWAATPRFTN